jgi:hypothetical protein
MRSELIASALCLLLCPLLAAQQVGQAESPNGKGTTADTLFAYRDSMRADRSGSFYGLSIIPYQAPVELTPVDPTAWESATIGSTLGFRVVNGVVVKGKADVYVGTLIEAKVIRIREGKLRTRNGKTEPRVKELLVGKSIRLDLESSRGGHSRFNGIAKNLVVLPMKAVAAVLQVPAWIILMIACSRGCDL